MKTSTFAALAVWCVAAAVVSCSKPGDPRAEAFAKLPDWRGIWIAEGKNVGITGFADDFGKPGSAPNILVGVDAPWSEAGRAGLAAMFAGSNTRKSPGWGYPMMMSSPNPLQFIVTPEETVILNGYAEVRHVYTDGRDHPKPEDRWLTTWGDSVGHWQGDTLVIDTIEVREPIKYFQMVPPLSEQAHYVERLHMTLPDRIESEMTIEDPLRLTKPWVVKLAYVHTHNLDRLVHDAFDNDRSELDGDAFTIAPPKQ